MDNSLFLPSKQPRMNALKLLSISMLLALLINTGCKCPECPEAITMPLIGTDTSKTKQLPVEKYAPEMIANYHQNLTTEQYRAVKAWQISVADLQSLIDAAKKINSKSIYFFPAANTRNTIEAYNLESNEDDEKKCVRWENMPTLIPGIVDEKGEVNSSLVCVEYCPPPESCGDSVTFIDNLYVIPEGTGTSMTLNQITKYKWPKNALKNK